MSLNKDDLKNLDLSSNQHSTAQHSNLSSNLSSL